MTAPRRPDPATTCARAADDPPSRTVPLAPALQLSAVYRVAGLEQIDALSEGSEPGFTYARDGHPNAAQLAAKVAALEGAEAALVCASGLAARDLTGGFGTVVTIDLGGCAEADALDPVVAAHPLRAQPRRRGDYLEPPRDDQPPRPDPRAMGATGDHSRPGPTLDRPGRPRGPLGRPGPGAPGGLTAPISRARGSTIRITEDE
jgi:hypothetical protein